MRPEEGNAAAAAGAGIVESGRFTRIVGLADGREYFFATDKLCGGSLTADGIVLEFAQPLDRLVLGADDLHGDAGGLWAEIALLLGRTTPRAPRPGPSGGAAG